MISRENIDLLNGIYWSKVRSCFTCRWGSHSLAFGLCKHPSCFDEEGIRIREIPTHPAISCKFHDWQEISEIDSLIKQCIAYESC